MTNETNRSWSRLAAANKHGNDQNGIAQLQNIFTTSHDGIKFSYRIMKVGNKIIDRLIIRIVELFL